MKCSNTLGGFLALAVLIFVLCSGPAAAQDKPTSDTALIYEWELAQGFSQRIMDSMVIVQLQKELDSAQDNPERTSQLKARIAKLQEEDSQRKIRQQQLIKVVKRSKVGFPVSPFGDTLFMIYFNLGSSITSGRAAQITARIQRLYDARLFNPDSLLVVPNEWGYEITYSSSNTIMLVSRLDALWFGRDTKELAEDYRNKIVQAIVQEKKENSLASWTKRILLVLLILAGSALLVTAITRLFNWLLKHVLRLSDTLFSRRIWFVPKQFQKQIVLRGIQTIRWAITLLALYMCLPLLFYVFPDTKDITDTLLNWIISPAKDIARGVLAFLPNLFTIIIVYLTIRFTIKGFGFFFGEIEKGQLNVKGFHSDFAKPTFNIVRFILYAFMLVVIFPYLPGSGSPAFQGVSVFLGILFSLGSSSAINNAIAGLVITYMRPFKIGDRVKIAETVGDVVEKSMLVIKIRSLKNEEITIPNSTVLSSSTINFSTNSSDPGLIIHSTVTIGYDTPWRNMHAALIKAASNTPGILPKPEPFVLQTSLDDFYVSYQVNAYTNEPNNQLAIYSLLHQNIQDCCTEAGIEIMSPHYRSVRDGSESTIPK